MGSSASALTARPRCSHVSLAQSSAAPPGGSSKPQRAIVRVVVGEGGVFKNTGVCGSSQRFEVLSDPNTRGDLPFCIGAAGYRLGSPTPQSYTRGVTGWGRPDEL